MDDPVAVALERRPDAARRLRVLATFVSYECTASGDSAASSSARMRSETRRRSVLPPP